MPRTVLHHLDENCAKAIAQGLRRHGIDVTTTPEARLMGVIDERQGDYALAQGRVLFTQDRDFLRLHSAGAAHAGIVFCEKDSRGVGEIIKALILLWEIYEPEEMTNRVEFV